MPELPEVETVRGTLEGQIIGKTITNIEVYYATSLKILRRRSLYIV